MAEQGDKDDTEDDEEEGSVDAEETTEEGDDETEGEEEADMEQDHTAVGHTPTDYTGRKSPTVGDASLLPQWTTKQVSDALARSGRQLDGSDYMAGAGRASSDSEGEDAVQKRADGALIDVEEDIGFSDASESTDTSEAETVKVDSADRVSGLAVTGNALDLVGGKSATSNSYSGLSIQNLLPENRKKQQEMEAERTVASEMWQKGAQFMWSLLQDGIVVSFP